MSSIDITGAHDAPVVERHSRYRFVVLLLLMFAYCMNYMDRQVVSILAVPIKTDLQLSDSQLGLMGGFAFAIFYSCLGIPIARLADRKNRVTIISLAFTAWSVCTALCGFANNFVQLLFTRLLVGVGEAGGVAPTYSLLTDYFPPRQRGKAMAVLTLGLPLGSALGLLLGGYFAQHYGWRAAFYLLGAIGVVTAPIVYFGIREPQRGRLDGDVAVPTATTSLADVLRHLARKPSFWLLSFAAATASMLSYGLGFWLPTYIYRSQNISLAETSYALSAVTVSGGLIGLLAGGAISDWLGEARKGAYAAVPCVAFVIGLPFMLLAMSVHQLVPVLLLLFIPQAAGVVWMGPSISAVQHLAPVHMRATTSAIFLFIVNLLGLGIGTLAFGALSDYYHSSYGDDALRYAIITVAIVLYPIAVIMFGLASRRLERDWETS
ncbi:MAG: MFS transporter [Sphingomonas sp. 28-66-16]|nr:MAG: MFS transporter [Sphingomonas sp. 28-66-16]